MAKNQEAKTVRLRNINSGAVVEVREEKVELLGSEWETAPARKASAAKKSAASDDK